MGLKIKQQLQPKVNIKIETNQLIRKNRNNGLNASSDTAPTEIEKYFFKIVINNNYYLA
jgi:hypothetical protein